MPEHINIPLKHFIGSGKHPWLIIGRAPGDDDDTGYLVLADNEGAAQASFRSVLLDVADLTDDELADLVASHGRDHIITTSQMLV